MRVGGGSGAILVGACDDEAEAERDGDTLENAAMGRAHPFVDADTAELLAAALR